MKSFIYEKPVYKYRTFDSLKLMLESEKFYFSCPAQFNDPFEFNERLLKFNFTESYVREQLASHNRVVSLPRKEKRKILVPDQTEFYKKTTRKLIDLKKKEYGVFCASEVYDNTLMWSHYANEHKGFCIGFEFPQTFDFYDEFMRAEQIISLYVNYVDKIEPKNIVVDNEAFSDETLRYWISTKSSVWEYEKEVRFMKYTGKGLVKFKPEWVKEIYFGLLTPKEEIQEIKKLMKSKNNDCKFYKMEFEKNGFQLVRSELKK